MQRRNFLIGAAGTAIGGSALVGSGAFTSVEADRDVEVAVADDADAFLQIEPADTDNGDEYAEVTGDDTVALDFTETEAGGEGINDRALTDIQDVITVSNQGTQPVAIGVDFLDGDGDPVGDQASVGVAGPVLRLQEGGPGFADDTESLEAGESINIGVFFNLGKDEDFEDVVDDLETIVIVADAEEV